MAAGGYRGQGQVKARVKAKLSSSFGGERSFGNRDFAQRDGNRDAAQRDGNRSFGGNVTGATATASVTSFGDRSFGDRKFGDRGGDRAGFGGQRNSRSRYER
jgi:hypothetical protein